MNAVKIDGFVAILAAMFLFNAISSLGQNTQSSNADGSLGLKVVNNPIIQRLGVCDPHIHIFGDKAYLFASHDREPGAKFYGMYDWWVWSSPDLVHWTMEFNLFPKDMWVGAGNNCWAVDGAERNGNYYFYVSGNWRTGVAMSTDGPGGPYRDVLKGSIPGVTYDPTVFIDDDENNTPYLITGHFPYKIARLNEDMISLAEEPKELVVTSQPWEGDGGFIHKHNGLYYLNGHGNKYLTATNVYGPYSYRGEYYGHWVDHPNFFSWNNQTYCAFGTRGVDKTFRKTHITYLHYNENGEMVACGVVGESFIGVGQYDCSEKIEAEWYFAASDDAEKKELESGFAVQLTADGASVYYPRILNLAADATISLQLASANDGGVIEVRQDQVDGTLLGVINVPNTGGLADFETAAAPLKSKEGLTNIYMVFKGEKGGSVTIDGFTLSSTGAIRQPPAPDPIVLAYKPAESTPAVSAFSQIEAEDLLCYNLLRTLDTHDNGPARSLTYLKNTSYASYKIDFGSRADRTLTFQARLAAQHPGSIEIRLDNPDGTLLGTCEFEATGGPGKYVTKECKLKAPGEVHHVFLVINAEEPEEYSNGYEVLCLNWIRFVQ